MSSFVHNVVEATMTAPPPPRHILASLFSTPSTSSPLHRSWIAPPPSPHAPNPPSSSPSTPTPSATSSSLPSPSSPPHPPPPATSDLLNLLNLEELDTNLFRGYSPPHPRWGRVYGGQTVSQAMIASSRTIPPPYTVHSLHSYFLRPGDDNLPIVYTVDVVRDGAAFAQRRVTAAQRGRPIFIALISFHRPEEGHLAHADPMPDVPPPDSLPSLVQTMREWAADGRLSAEVRAGILRSSSFPFPIDLRRVDNHSLTTRLSKARTATQRCWMKVTGHLPPAHTSPIVHQCALAYMSDWSLLETALLPHGEMSYKNTPQRSLQMASLDHSMYFHTQLLRADEWLLYEMHSSWAGGGRGLVRGQFFDGTGRLVVSVVQEGLIRLKITPPQQQPSAGEEGEGGKEVKSGEGGGEAGGEGGQGGGGDGMGSGGAAGAKLKPSNHFTVLPNRAKL